MPMFLLRTTSVSFLKRAQYSNFSIIVIKNHWHWCVSQSVQIFIKWLQIYCKRTNVSIIMHKRGAIMFKLMLVIGLLILCMLWVINSKFIPVWSGRSQNSTSKINNLDVSTTKRTTLTLCFFWYFKVSIFDWRIYNFLKWVCCIFNGISPKMYKYLAY